jgi:predicted ester cyclase
MARLGLGSAKELIQVGAVVGSEFSYEPIGHRDRHRPAWFAEFWGNLYNIEIVEQLAAANMLMQYSLHAPCRGHAEIKTFMSSFREAFPDLNFWRVGDLVAEGDFVVGRWEGGGTHTGPAFNDFRVGGLPAASGRKMRFTRTTVLRLENGKITEENGLDDDVTALQQLGIARAARITTLTG